MKRIAAFAILLSALTGAPAQAQKNGRAETLLEAARQKETLEGDLKGAIRQYEEIVRRYPGERPVAAKALLQMGLCQEKLGNAEATKAYERILSDYADQRETAAQARARVAALAPPVTRTPSARQIWMSRSTVDPTEGTPSSDGRYICFTDWETGDLGVRDLTSGVSRLLTNTGGWEASGDYAYGCVISPDGNHVAYYWSVEFRNELRVLPMSGGSSRTLHRSDDPNEYMSPQGWTPDGKQLLVLQTAPDSTKRIAMVSLQDGSVRTLKSFPWQDVKATLSPDGRHIAYHSPADNNTLARDIFVLAADGSRETAVVRNPADDTKPVWSPDGSRILFLSDRTGNHSLWSAPVADGKPAGPEELVKADLGTVFPLGMTNTGAWYYVSAGAMRWNIYMADLGADMRVSKQPAVAAERFVNSNIGPALSPDGEFLAYYSRRPGSLHLVVRTLKTGEEKDLPLGLGVVAVFGSGPKWFPDGRSILVLVRESQRPGFGFSRVELVSGKREVLHHARQSGFQGFALSPDGKTIFYTEGSPDGRDFTTSLMRFDLDKRQVTELKAGEWFISPAVSPDGKQLAYLVSVRPGSSSYLAVMPAAGGESREVFRDSPWLDGSRYATLAWSPDQRYLIFARGGVSDSTPNVLWRVPVAGGQPEPMGLSMLARIKTPQPHPDGRRIFFGAMENGPSELWALENFLPTLKAAK